MSAIKLQERAAALTDYFSPRVIGEVNDVYVKVAKIKGDDIPWHNHAGEDELFYILRGSLRIDMEDRSVTLGPGELFVVPKGVRHRPVADEECHLMLIERKSTQHTGDVVSEHTRTLDEQLRPV